MGLTGTRWEATHDGRAFTITRNELTKGFAVECDGRIVASKRWSLIGVGEVTGSLEHAGRPVAVRVRLGLSVRPRCTLWVDGTEVPVHRVR